MDKNNLDITHKLLLDILEVKSGSKIEGSCDDLG